MSLRTAGERYPSSSSGVVNVFREHERHFNIRLLVIGTLLSLGLISGVIFLPKLLFQEASPGIGRSVSFKTPPLTNSQVLGICSKQAITKDFIATNPTYHTKVTLLDKKTLEGLALTSPAIYADLPQENGLYKVRYLGEEEGIMLILDPKNKEILKYYRVRTLTFP